MIKAEGEQIQIGYQAEILGCEDRGALVQVAQRNCGFLTPGTFLNHAGWGLEQPQVVEGVPAHGRKLELGGLQDPLYPKLFCDSMEFLDSCLCIKPLWFSVKEDKNFSSEVPLGVLLEALPS